MGGWLNPRPNGELAALRQAGLSRTPRHGTTHLQDYGVLVDGMEQAVPSGAGAEMAGSVDHAVDSAGEAAVGVIA